MSAVPCGNFAFLAGLDRELYENLHAAEKNTRINYRESGRAIRDALDRFIMIVVTEKHAEQKLAKAVTLADKIKSLRDELPREERVSFTQEDGQIGSRYTFAYIRIFGNSCSHPEIKPENPKVTYEHLILCLRVFHKALISYYGRRIGRWVDPFDENLTPIDDLIIYKSYVPSDSDRSTCSREFLGYTVDEDGEKDGYSLVRLYNRNETGGAFMLRNQKCFREVSRKTPRPLPGMLHLEALTPQQSTDSDFYMIRYSFNQEPHPLETFNLKRLSMEQRVEICKKLADCLDKLHHSRVPVFHRMLSYESAFLSEIEGEWFPYIVKFDYAKIISNRPTETVVVNTMNAKRLVARMGREKYLAPEWKTIEENPSLADWEKVDVYSLGILMGDILRGSFDGGIADARTLTGLGVPQWMLKALAPMLSQAPARRCTMKDVMEAMNRMEA